MVMHIGWHGLRSWWFASYVVDHFWALDLGPVSVVVKLPAATP